MAETAITNAIPSSSSGNGGTHAAAFLKEKGQKLVVDKIEPHSPGPNQVLIKNHAIAINPVDWKMQDYGMFIKQYPTILGTDVAGEIEAVGEGVKDFKKGDRVMGYAIGLLTGSDADKAYQTHTTCSTSVISKLPSSISYSAGSVLPLALSTAAAGLYFKDVLALPYPTLSPTPQNKTILIWGGAASVGTAAIQLAVASGLDVVTTASARNHDLCKTLGAKEVYDYTSDSIVDDLASALKGKDLAAIFDAAGTPPAVKTWLKVVEKLGNPKVTVGAVIPTQESLPENVKLVQVFAAKIAVPPEVGQSGKAVWHDWVPQALEQGKLVCKPDPLEVGKGLETLQKAMEKQKEGVSAQKVVVTL